MIAQGVFSLAQAMNAAVQLDDQLEVKTEEVGDIASERGLTPEFPTFEAAIAEQGPEADLGWRGVGSETTGAARSVWRLMHAFDVPPHPTCSAGHLLPRGEKDFEHYILKTPKRVSGMGAFRLALMARPRTSRVWAGSMTPSSHRRAVA